MLFSTRETHHHSYCTSPRMQGGFVVSLSWQSQSAYDEAPCPPDNRDAPSASLGSVVAAVEVPASAVGLLEEAAQCWSWD